MGLNEVSDLRGAQRGLWTSVSSVELSELSRAQGAMRSSVSSVELSKLCGVALTAVAVCHPHSLCCLAPTFAVLSTPPAPHTILQLVLATRGEDGAGAAFY